jgi:YhcH/YjgK/YiaL family protein
MIFDQLSQWRRYAKLGARFEQACRYLETVNAQTPLGRHELDGNNLFALVQTYPTKPVEQCRFEAHRQYTDIQFIVTGREKILWSPLAALTTVTQPYNAEKDVAFFAAPAVATPLPMESGQFAVFFPEDGHAPGAECGGIAAVLKVVMKLRG